MGFYHLSRSFLKGFFWAFYGHKVHFCKDVTFPKGAIIAANHASFFDPPLVAISWPEPIHFLARKTLFDVPILSPIIKGLNAHPLASGSELAAFKAACKLLKEGKTMLIFPEGTRTKDGEITPFKSGASLLAMKTGAPIVPVYIEGSFEAWPRHKKLPIPFGYKTACTIGRPIYPDQFENVDAITSHLQHAIDSLRLRRAF